jgi:hypothetical protein
MKHSPANPFALEVYSKSIPGQVRNQLGLPVLHHECTTREKNNYNSYRLIDCDSAYEYAITC